MKKILLSILSLAGLLAAACDKVPGLVPPEPAAKTVNIPEVPWTGSDGFLVDISANVEVLAEFPGAETWLNYYGMEITSRSTGARTLIFTAQPNPVKEERSALVYVLAKDGGKRLLEFTLTQAAAQDPYLKVAKTESLSFNGGESTLRIDTNVPFTASSHEDWLSVTAVQEDACTVNAQPNPNPEPREAVITFLFDGKTVGTATLIQEGRPSKGIELERVWGKYIASDAAWFAAAGFTSNDQDRFIAMDDNFVYTSIIANGNPGDSWGISVFRRTDGSYVKTLRDDAGIEKVGLWAVSALQVLDDGEGGSVLVACNMSRKAENNILKIYAWTSIDQAPQVVTYSYAATHPDSRIGDKMGVSGNWKQGELYFADYIASKPRVLLIFSITNGVISATPVDTHFAGIVSGNSNMSSLYPLNDGLYMYYGASASTEYANCLVQRTGNSFSDAVVSLLPSKGFDAVMNGFHVLPAAGKSFLLWVTCDRSLDKTVRASFVKTLMLEGSNVGESIKALGNMEAAQVYPLAHPTDLAAAPGRNNGNLTGDLALRQIDGTWYVAALGTGSGISVFKVTVL